MIGIITFVFGYFLLGFVCYVTMANVPEWTAVHYHLWFIVAICYTILSGTLLFSKFIAKNVDKRIATWLFDWPARSLLVAMLGISAGLGFYVENINACYILDAASVFIYMLALVLTRGTTKHIQNVQKEENQKRVLIDEVRKASLSLGIVAQNLPDEFSAQKKQIEAIKDDLRHLSPSSNSEAISLEESILKQLQEIKNDCISGQGILPQRISLINACIAERKNIY